MKQSVYSLTLEYEAGGVGKALLENMIVRLDFPPGELGCHIYTIPPLSKPAGAMHRLQVWLRSPFTIEEDLHFLCRCGGSGRPMSSELGGYLDFMDIDPRRITAATPVKRLPLRIRTTEPHRSGRGDSLLLRGSRALCACAVSLRRLRTSPPSSTCFRYNTN